MIGSSSCCPSAIVRSNWSSPEMGWRSIDVGPSRSWCGISTPPVDAADSHRIPRPFLRKIHRFRAIGADLISRTKVLGQRRRREGFDRFPSHAYWMHGATATASSIETNLEGFGFWQFPRGREVGVLYLYGAKFSRGKVRTRTFETSVFKVHERSASGNRCQWAGQTLVRARPSTYAGMGLSGSKPARPALRMSEPSHCGQGRAHGWKNVTLPPSMKHM